MAVNYGLLTPQETAHNMQPLPQYPTQANPLNSLAGGIMSGVQEGQQVAKTRQDMQQSKELFPIQKANAEAVSTQNQIAARAAAQGEQDAATMRAHNGDTEANYIKVLGKTVGPAAVFQYQKTKADAQKVISEIALINSNTAVNSPQAQAGVSITLMQAVNAAQQAESQKPGDGQKVWDIMGTQLPPDVQKALGEKGFNKFNSDTFAAFHTIGMDAAASMKAAQENKNSTNSQRNAKRIANLEEKSSLSSTETRELEILKANNQAQNARGNPLDAKLAEVDAQRLSKYHEGSDAAPSIVSAVDKANEILSRPGMESKVGPIIDITKLNKLSPDVQELGSVVNQLALTAKAMNNMPSNTFSEADRNFVATIAGTTAFNIKSLKATLDRMKDLSKQAVENTYKQEEKIRKGSASYKQWKEQNPGPDLSPFESKKSESKSSVNLTFNPATGKLE